MIILGDKIVPYENTAFISNKDEIKNTKLTVNKLNLMRWQKEYKESGRYGFIKKSRN